MNFQVSSIKKVDPGTPGPVKPAGTPGKGAGWRTTPNKGLTTQKSFKESIEEKAALMARKGSNSSNGAEGLPPRPPAAYR